MAGNLVPRTDGGANLGTASKEWDKLYVKGLAGTIATLIAPLLNPNFKGIPTAPTAPGGTSTTQIATTKFVIDEIVDAIKGTIIPETDGTADLGSASKEYDQIFVKRLGGTVAGLIAMKDTSDRGTAYSARAAVTMPGIPVNMYLECTTPGTTSATAPTITLPVAKGDIISDGTVEWTVREYENTVFKDSIINAGASHNSIFRGKDLTSYFESGDMSAAITDGSFADIYIGDYITKSINVSGTTYNVKWEVAHLDYFLHTGDTECTDHHVVLFPSGVVKTNVPMNASNTTVGGYVGSKMWTETIPTFNTAIEAAFGASHVLSHKELLTTSIDANAKSVGSSGMTGASNNWAWTTTKANIPSEPMIYGHAVWGSDARDVGNKDYQLAIFKFKRYCEDRKWFWLQAVVSSSYFASAGYVGHPSYHGASGSDSFGGVRPYFLLR